MKWNEKLNKRYTLLSIYIIVTASIIYCLSLVAKSAPAIISDIIDKLQWVASVAKPIVFAFVIAYLFNPIIRFFELQYHKIRIFKREIKSCRTWAVFTTILIIIFIFAGIISLLVFSITDQIRLANFDDIIALATSYSNSVNEFYQSVLVKLGKLDIGSAEISKYVTETSTNVLNILKDMAGSVVISITNISSNLTIFLFSFIIGIYFMIDGTLIKDYVKKVGNALLSDRWNTKVARFLADADSVFSGYIRGQLLDAVVMMILISLTLSVIGVKFAIIIGVLAGIGNLIPYCGPFVAYFSTIIVCVVNGQYKELIIAAIALFIIQTIDGNIIAPKLLSKSIEIHPVLVIISLIFGSAIGGLLGMLLAVPVGALIKLIFARYVDHKLEKKETERVEKEPNEINKI